MNKCTLHRRLTDALCQRATSEDGRSWREDWTWHDLADAVLAELSPELELLAEIVPAELVDQTQLGAVSVHDGMVDLQLHPPHELALVWIGLARRLLDDAPNYAESRVEMVVTAAGETERFIFTVQRAGKVTPHEARRKAEADRDDARVKLAHASDMLRGMARRLARCRKSLSYCLDGATPTFRQQSDTEGADRGAPSGIPYHSDYPAAAPPIAESHLCMGPRSDQMAAHRGVWPPDHPHAGRERPCEHGPDESEGS